METLHSAGEYEFAEGKKPAIEAFQAFMESLPVQITLKEVATKDKAGKGAAASTGAEFGEHVDTDRLEIHNKALAYAEENKVSYQVAVAHVGKGAI